MGRIERQVRLDAPIDEVFAFFAGAHNLERITPDTLKFQVLTPRPIEMRAGTLIDYALKVRGIPMRWTSLISAWNPPHSFIDEQLRGPYIYWHHEHWFRPDGDGTIAGDVVRYAAPGGRFAEKWAVDPDVKRIFDHRAEQMADLFGAAQRA